MNRRITRLLIALFASSFGIIGTAAERPNVVFISVDDLRPEIRSFGAQHMHTPNLDRLAATGTAFLNAHCQQAVCSPSRTSLMTGLRPDSTKVYDLQTHFRDTVPDVVTLPQHFIRHGYHAVSMGKIYHSRLDDAPSWSVPPLRPARPARWLLPESIEIMERRRAEAVEKGLTGLELDRAARGPAFERADVPDDHYLDGSIAKLAVETLATLKEKQQPFFLAVGFLNPHLPFNSPENYWALYDPETIELAPNPFPPKNAYRNALTSFGEMRVYAGIPQKGPIPDDLARQLRHGYYAAVSYIDACVGRILDELDRLDLADDTIVVLWSDHGWKLGEHASWCKHTNVHLDTKAPLIFRAPGQKTRGVPSPALVEFVDIYPALCELAGLPLPPHLEGDSLAPLLDRPDKPWKRAAFSQYPRGNVMGHSLTTDGFRYTVWVEQRNRNRIVARELYDHRTDPQENENVIDNPEHAETIRQLHRIYEKGWQGVRPRSGE